MVKAEITQKSPLRSLEKAVQGGLGKGNIGVIASKKGIGKTACLVHIATDKLFQNKHVIHVSYSNRTDHIQNWYEDIFKEISTKRNLESAMEVHDEIIKNKIVMNFNQKGLPAEHVLASIEALINNGNYDMATVIVDGYDFNTGSVEDIKTFHELAQKNQVEVWFSDSYAKDGPTVDEQGIPVNLADYMDNLSVIVTMHTEKDGTYLNLVKDHEKILDKELQLKLDSKTLLLSEK